MARYHDEEWGRPCFDATLLFECLNLEGAQAGLSWRSVLVRREGYRTAFLGFDPEAVAGLSDEHLEEILRTGEVIRNRAKVFGVRQNARAWLALAEPASFLWSFVGGSPLDHARQSLAEVPATSDESVAMSKALKKAGFTFCGPTICYAFMQAVGMVNDHVVTCPAYEASKV
jgi:DNA-3-methyladenine glycosylase I